MAPLEIAEPILLPREIDFETKFSVPLTNDEPIDFPSLTEPLKPFTSCLPRNFPESAMSLPTLLAPLPISEPTDFTASPAPLVL